MQNFSHWAPIPLRDGLPARCLAYLQELSLLTRRPNRLTVRRKFQAPAGGSSEAPLRRKPWPRRHSCPRSSCHWFSRHSRRARRGVQRAKSRRQGYRLPNGCRQQRLLYDISGRSKPPGLQSQRDCSHAGRGHGHDRQDLPQAVLDSAQRRCVRAAAGIAECRNWRRHLRE